VSVRMRFNDGIAEASFNAPDAAFEQIAVDGVVDVERMTATREGLEMQLPGRVVTYQPISPSPSVWQWREYFDRVVYEALGHQPAPFEISFSGALAVPIMLRGDAEYRRALIDSTRGRPRRLQRWDPIREELYARILQRQQQHGESLRDAVWSTATLEPDRFRRAFGGRPTKRRIEAAVSYFKRHASDVR
jgi:hypothetical protein